MEKTYTVSEEEKKQFASAYLLEKMVNEHHRFPLLLEGNDKDLEPVLEYMLTRDYVGIKEHSYVPTEKGRQVVTRFLRRYTDFLRNFDVYCAVDLESGDFAFEEWFEYEEESEWVGYLSEDRWEDLRIAVSEFKGLNPVEIVFMSFLNEERFGQDEEGWQFDLLLGTIWDEILEICETALKVDDLAYVDEEGNEIGGEDVIKDVLKRGAELNHWIKEEEATMAEDEADDDDEGPYRGRNGDVEEVVVEEVEDHVYRGYYDPFYVSPVWLALVFL